MAKDERTALFDEWVELELDIKLWANSLCMHGRSIIQNDIRVDATQLKDYAKTSFGQLMPTIYVDRAKKLLTRTVAFANSNMRITTKVVHCKKEDYDVYIGRGKCPKTGQPGKFGNPYSHEADSQVSLITSSREESIIKYKQWALTQPWLLDDIMQLDGLRLGCWCKPKACHGDVIVELIEARKRGEI